MSKIYREITPLTANDCFMVFARNKNKFDFPLHYHEEYELNFIENAEGAKRVIGDSVEFIANEELVLVGSNIPHGWFSKETETDSIHEITIQFHRDLFDEKFLKRIQMNRLRTMLERSARGLVFSQETIQKIKPQLIKLTQTNDFNSVIELLSILHHLSVSKDSKMLTSPSFTNGNSQSDTRRIEKVLEYMRKNYQQDLSLEDISKVLSMTVVSFSRFIKKMTGKTFVDSLNEIRLDHATRLLVDSNLSIADISSRCGYNNLSYFNRIFKKKHNCTPKEYRDNYSSIRTFV